MVRHFYWITIVCAMHINMVYAVPTSLKVGVFNEHDTYLKSSSIYQVSWQLFIQAAKNAGIKIVAQPDAWARSVASVRSGDFDGVFGAMITKDRQAWASFSLALGYDQVRLFTQPDTSINSLSQVDYSTQTVGVSKHSIHHEVAKAKGFANIYSYVGEEQIYKMLFAGRLDFIIFAESLMRMYCHQHVNTPFDACLKPIGKPFLSQSIHVMYNKSNSVNALLFKQIDKQIQKMYLEGEIRKIFDEKIGQEEPYINWEKFYLLSKNKSQMASL